MPTTCARPIPVTNRRCRRCGCRALIFVPKTAAVRCVECLTRKTYARLTRTLTREGGR